MRVILIIVLIILCLFQQHRVNKLNKHVEHIDSSFFIIAGYCENNIDNVRVLLDERNMYQSLYLKANTRLKQWDSMAPFLINLSGVKVK